MSLVMRSCDMLAARRWSRGLRCSRTSTHFAPELPNDCRRLCRMSANRAAGKTVGFLNSASPGTDISMLLHFYDGRAGRGGAHTTSLCRTCRRALRPRRDQGNNDERPDVAWH